MPALTAKPRSSARKPASKQALKPKSKPEEDVDEDEVEDKRSSGKQKGRTRGARVFGLCVTTGHHHLCCDHTLLLPITPTVIDISAWVTSIYLPLGNGKGAVKVNAPAESSLDAEEIDADPDAGKLEKSDSDTSLTSTSEEEIMAVPTIKIPVKVKPKRLTAAKRKAAEVVEAPQKIALLVPTAEADLGAQHKLVTLPQSFLDILETIYKTIGCVSILRKPVLSYKLENAMVKSLPLSLTCDEDWEGLMETAVASHLKKSKAQQVAPLQVRIIVTEQAPKKVVGKGKNAKPVLLDLDGDENSDDDEDGGQNEGGIAEGEAKCLQDLEAKLTKCQKYGPTKMCKINRSGAHIALSFN
ncbi:hypothetical protein Hypma_005273 [Hypsizygus marmoreus]|uniref:Uncharacterized protein n=1 Tax=Hypsizygus marmoreus TaxID=39966 RepID=A0A369JWQ9_HYPMA|nr:hypothetical protein Hypma_005273 [Hypsizygus marmoreus]